jgi:hypothetical protein
MAKTVSPAGPLLGAPNAKPWPRYFARWLDTTFASLSVGVLVAVLKTVSLLGSSPILKSSVALSMLPFAAWALVEGPILSSFGTTPGKALLGIFVRTPDSRYPRLGDAVVRSLRVWVEGLAFGIPIILLFTWNRQHRRLLAGKSTTWDADGRFKILHTPLTSRRKIVVALVTVALLTITILGPLPVLMKGVLRQNSVR